MSYLVAPKEGKAIWRYCMSGIKRSRIPRLTGFIAKSTTRQGGGEQSAPMADFYGAPHVASARRSRVGIRAVCNREETHRRGVRLPSTAYRGSVRPPRAVGARCFVFSRFCYGSGKPHPSAATRRLPLFGARWADAVLKVRSRPRVASA